MINFINKLISCGLAGVLAIGIAGCSGGSSNSESKSDNSTKSGYSLVKDGTLTVGTSADYPPFENLENGEAVGLDIDIAKAVAEELGLKCEVKNLQFDAILPAIQSGGQVDIGISGITVDPDRKKTVDFTSSYYTDDQAIATMKDSGITKNNANEELNKSGVVIAVQSGTTGEDYCKENYPNATIQSYGNSTDAFAAMQAGQANAVCTNAAVVKNMLASAYTNAEVVVSVATGEEYAIAVSRDNSELTKLIDEAIKKLTDSGKIEELTNKWLG